jgi:hypothetical protein
VSLVASQHRNRGLADDPNCPSNGIRRGLAPVALPCNAMADTPLRLTITVGRDKFDVQANGGMTWADVLLQLSEQRGAEELRLLHKGKTVVPSQTLLSASVKDGTKLMALKTAGQHGKEKKAALRSAAVAADKAVDHMRCRTPAAVTVGTAASASKRGLLGDEVDEDDNAQYYVRVTHGPKTYRVLFSGDAAQCATVHDLKVRLEGLANVQVRHQRLIFRGKRDLSDDFTLATGLGAKRGALFMLLFSSEQHDAVDARQDIGVLSTQTEALSSRVVTVEKKVRGRLLSDYVELTLAVGELEAECDRLIGNVGAVQGQAVGCTDGDRALCEALASRLVDLSNRILSLRSHATATQG